MVSERFWGIALCEAPSEAESLKGSRRGAALFKAPLPYIRGGEGHFLQHLLCDFSHVQLSFVYKGFICTTRPSAL